MQKGREFIEILKQELEKETTTEELREMAEEISKLTKNVKENTKKLEYALAENRKLMRELLKKRREKT